MPALPTEKPIHITTDKPAPDEMPDKEAVRRCASGMLKTFGTRAHSEAMACAIRFARRADHGAEMLWHEIAAEIKRRKRPEAQRKTAASSPSPSVSQ